MKDFRVSEQGQAKTTALVERVQLLNAAWRIWRKHLTEPYIAQDRNCLSLMSRALKTCALLQLDENKQTEEGRMVQDFCTCWQKCLLKPMFAMAEFSFCADWEWWQLPCRTLSLSTGWVLPTFTPVCKTNSIQWGCIKWQLLQYYIINHSPKWSRLGIFRVFVLKERVPGRANSTFPLPFAILYSLT